MVSLLRRRTARVFLSLDGGETLVAKQQTRAKERSPRTWELGQCGMWGHPATPTSTEVIPSNFTGYI